MRGQKQVGIQRVAVRTEGPRAAAHGPLVQTVTAQQSTQDSNLPSVRTGEGHGQQDQEALCCRVLSGKKRRAWHRGPRCFSPSAGGGVGSQQTSLGPIILKHKRETGFLWF